MTKHAHAMSRRRNHGTRHMRIPATLQMQESARPELELGGPRKTASWSSQKKQHMAKPCNLLAKIEEYHAGRMTKRGFRQRRRCTDPQGPSWSSQKKQHMAKPCNLLAKPCNCLVKNEENHADARRRMTKHGTRHVRIPSTPQMRGSRRFLRAEGFDGVHACGFPGGVEAESDPDRHACHGGHHHDPAVERHREIEERLNQQS